MMKKPLMDFPLGQFSELAVQLEAKPYVGEQLVSWLYQKRVNSFEEMTNLPKKLRDQLAQQFVIDALEVEAIQEGTDGTKKYLCRLSDGAKIECVLIPDGERERLTACVSSQVGCAMGCGFCRTARMGFVRNLSLGEIVGQLRLMMKQSPAPVTNVVFMGMGEPLANVHAVSDAVELMLSQKAFGLGKHRITLSTSGLLPQLKRFCERHDIKLALSLSAPTDELRNHLMPINRRYPIAELMEFCRFHSARSRHYIMFEYVLIDGVNDRPEDAEKLARLLKGVRAKVNLIPMNPFEGCAYQRPPEATYQWWSDFLWKHHIPAPVRISGGNDILAACGQLATSMRCQEEQPCQ